MTISAQQIVKLIENELSTVTDSRVVAHIRGLIVSPEMVLRNWDYGKPDLKYPCWSVLKHEKSNTGIAYSEFGFGPTYPWGLVSLFGTVNEKSMGMDCGWFPSFVEAYLDSTASTELPIWQVFKRDNGDSNPEVAITAESDWDSTWEIVYEYRKIDKNAVYNCHHNVNYRKSKI